MKKRDAYFDNGKFILIFLVVFGHLIRSFINDSESILALYKVIYTFHMPAFILISGFFSKGFKKKGYIKTIGKKLIIPYLIFQLLYTVFYYFLYTETTFQVDPLDPQWALWFLISLFCWNILLYVFAKFKPLVGLSLAFLIGLLVGYEDSISNYLSLSRTFVFFPLFLLGFHMNKEHFCKLLKPQIKIAALCIFVAVYVGFYLFPYLDYQWLLGSKPYSEMGEVSLLAPFKRMGIYLLSIIMVFSFFAFVPLKSYFFTHFGKNTMYVYLFHGFIIKPFRESDVKEYFHDPENIILLVFLSFILTLLLSSKAFTAIAQPVIELRASKLKQGICRIKTMFKYHDQKLQNKWMD